MNQEQVVGSPRLVKNWLMLVGTWILAVGLFQVGCGGGSKAAGQVDESPESSMTSEVAGSDDSAEASAESSAEASGDDVAAVDESASSDEIAAAGEEPEADTLLATEGMETEKETKAEEDASVSIAIEESEAETASSVGSKGASSAEGVGAYTVVKGDCLWRIAEKPSIYQDPWEWPLLYHANEKIVSNPDLIHTGWNLEIPRGVEEAMIVAAVQEARAAHYVPPSRAMRVVSHDPASASKVEKPVGNGKPAVVTTAKPAGDAKPVAVKKSGGLRGILWVIILAVLGAAGYLYWKKMNAGKSLGMGTASF